MESLIAKLLGDFEDGKMSRRQLIQSLALCATAPAIASAAQAPAASGAGAAAGAPAPWKTVYLDHISYSVADYKKSAAFYSNLMGWTIRNDNGTNQASLDIGNVGGIIIRNSRRPAGEGAHRRGRGRAAGAAASPAADRRDQSHLVRRHAMGHRRREGRTGAPRPEPEARHGRRQLQELSRVRSGRMGPADQQQDQQHVVEGARCKVGSGHQGCRDQQCKLREIVKVQGART